MFKEPVIAVSQHLLGDTLFVKFSDRSCKYYNAVKLGCEWFRMSNDCFFELYGFNFNPHDIPGLYEKCRKIVHGNLA